jgi:rhamnogalacturonyl hydrolase YesR
MTETLGPLEARVARAMLAMQRRAWEQGVAAQALLESGEADLAVLLALDAVANQAKDGRLGLNGDTAPVTDPAANGEPLLHAARVTGDPALRRAADRMLAFALERAPRTPRGVVFHNHVENMVWVDALYMLPPFLAAAGRHAEAVAQVRGTRDLLCDPRTGLYHHVWDEDLGRYARPQYWGVGNGWAAAGVTRVLRALPPSLAGERGLLAGYLREHLAACLRHQRPDGLFHDVLDDPATFVETNAGQMIAYAVFRGVAGGWLDRSLLAPAERARAAARAKVDDRGLVQGVCGAPRFDRPGTATEGQAFFLLMEAARRDLAAAA